MKPIDHQARQTALQPERSFIIQAPAGSGKTELLTQRYLRLLALVERPEEILAITFTRKAAREMRNRILAALNSTEQPEPAAPHEQLTWKLASAALARDAAQGWNTLQNPDRIRVQTIDALSTRLAQQQPVLSGFGAKPQVAENSEELYRQAAVALLDYLGEQSEHGAAVASVLAHLDNQVGRFIPLVVAMLAKRDQWLRHVVTSGGADDREYLEQVIQRQIDEQLEHLQQIFPQSLQQELLSLLQFAQSNLADDHQLAQPKLERWPQPGSAQLTEWQLLADFMLTANQTSSCSFRKRLTKSEGFPAAGSKVAGAAENKQALLEILNELADHRELCIALNRARLLPAPSYSEQQWQVVESLLHLLKLAVAELQLVFAESGQVDFSEMALAAIRSLGDALQPTDLALKLDYRIQHLLIDEFQDTSVGQFELLERLTAGWQSDDGRSLFLVGDPMQSIYRFREAEVGLYLQAKQVGVGELAPESLSLSVNFRSKQTIIDWVNRAFSKVFPEQDDIALGAVSLARADSFDSSDSGRVNVVPYLGRDDQGEAQQVADIVEQRRAEDAEANIAILVRSRGHALNIIFELQKRAVPHSAVDMERLGQRQPILDLLSLTRALLHPADHVAWLAVLRAPWCALSLADLAIVRDLSGPAQVAQCIADPERIAGLSADGQQRLQRVAPLLLGALEQSSRGSFADRVESLWLALGGAECLQDAGDLEDSYSFLEALASLEQHSSIGDLGALETALTNLYASAAHSADSKLEIMTIHKAKGLEFDTVIVPGLGRQPRHDEAQLLLWEEFAETDGQGESDSALLLAPIKAPAGTDRLYDMLRQRRQSKDYLEIGRLLYVACTRAESELYLLGHVKVKDHDGDWEITGPAKGSLLEQLYPVVESDFQQALADGVNLKQTEDTEPDYYSTDWRRLPPDWQQVPLANSPVLSILVPSNAEETSPEFDWASDAAREIGIIVHRQLELMATQGAAHWDQAHLHELRPHFVTQLNYAGLSETETQAAIDRIEQALTKVLADDTARWILSDTHQGAQSELALSTIENGRPVRRVIDRTFVDSDGTRWIIDFKTGSREGGDLEGFVRQEVDRYRPQLERYQRLFEASDKAQSRAVKLALYFPFLQRFEVLS